MNYGNSSPAGSAAPTHAVTVRDYRRGPIFSSQITIRIRTKYVFGPRLTQAAPI